MKKFDFSRKFKNFKGIEFGTETMAEQIASVLFGAGATPELAIDNADKFRAYKLSTKLIAGNGVIEISDEDAAFLEKYCAMAFSAGAYGQIMDILKQ